MYKSPIILYELDDVFTDALKEREDQLIEAQDFERSAQYNATAMLLDGLKKERRLRFEPLIDWHRIAEGMGMKR